MKKVIINILFFSFFTPALCIDFIDSSIVKKAYMETQIGFRLPGFSRLLALLPKLFLEGQDPVLDLQLVFHKSEELDQENGALLHSHTLFQKVVTNIPPLKAHHLSLEAAFRLLNNNKILTSTNIKYCLKYPQHAYEVASALVELRSKRYTDGSPPVLIEWINKLSPMDMNAALTALYAHGEFSPKKVKAVLHIMSLLKDYPDITLNAFLVGKSTRYGIDRSCLRKNVSIWQYAYSVVINFTRSISSWTIPSNLYSENLRSLSSFDDILPLIIESYILEKQNQGVPAVLPGLFSEKYVLEKYMELIQPQKCQKLSNEPTYAAILQQNESPESSRGIPFKIDKFVYAKLHEDLKEFIVELGKGYDNRTRYMNCSPNLEEEQPFFDPITLDVMQIPIRVPTTSIVGNGFCLLSLIQNGIINNEGFISIPNTLDWVNLKDLMPDIDTQAEFNAYCLKSLAFK